MRKIAVILTFSILMLGFTALEEGKEEAFPKYFYKVNSNPKITENVNHEGTGHFYNLVNMSDDTLNVYIQGVVKGRVEPDYEKASKADLVIWCFPQEYSHSSHIFPKAKGRILIQEKNGEVVVASESFLKSNGLWNGHSFKMLN